MSPDATSLSDPLGPAPASGAGVSACARLLEAGGLVVFPTETLHGAGVRGDRAEVVSRLAAMIGQGHAPEREADLGGTLHLPSIAALMQVGEAAFGVAGFAPGHQRLISRLLPGPVRILISLEREQMARARDRTGLAPGAAEVGNALAVRVPSHADCAALLLAVRAPVVAVSAAALGGRSDEELSREWKERLKGDAPFGRLAAAEGGEPRGMHSTTVLLTGTGGVSVVDEGAVSRREVARAMERRVLFVCTGNTCRSPMAEGIARRVVERAGPSPIRVVVSSAGTSGGGGGATGEAVEAMRALGIDISGHRSRELTRRVIDEADEIYAMTDRHARAIVAMAPDAASKVRLLDPEGRDVEDPIGLPLSEYRGVATALERMIVRRLSEDGGPRGKDSP